MSYESDQDYWGFWNTAGFGLLIAGAFIGIQLFITVVLPRPASTKYPQTRLEQPTPLGHGQLIAIAVTVSGVACTLLTCKVAELNRTPDNEPYLDLEGSPAKSVALWTLIGLAVSYALSATFKFFDLETGETDFMVEVYRTVKSPLLLWMAVALVAPMFEEIFFRGFLYTGFAQTELGPLLAIPLTSMAWAAIHFQYGLTMQFLIFLVGIVLGTTRAITGNIAAPLSIHIIWNVVALIQTSKAVSA